MNNLLEDAVKRGLFDANWYQSFYKLSFSSELEAFLDCMRKSKYADISPSPNFDTVSYYENYPDIYDHGGFSALEHYLMFGRKEGKLHFPLRPIWTPRSVLATTNTQSPKKGRYAIVIHIFYADYIDIFTHALTEVDFQFDLFITTTSQNICDLARNKFSSNLHIDKIEARLVPNRGRNFGPFLVEFGKRLMDYDFFCHLHSKKSLYSGKAQVHWASYLIEFLLNDKQVMSKALNIMESNSNYGLYYPVSFWAMPSWVNHWLKNKNQGMEYVVKNGMIADKDDFFPYPVGGMFWARSSALAPILEKNWTYEDFPQEPVPADGTFLHVLERLIPKIAESRKFGQFFYNPATGDFTEDSSWVFGSYLHGYTYTRLKQTLPSFDIISFDIFDTLVKRDYYEPDYAKYLLPSRLGLTISAGDFVAARNRSELKIRQEKNFIGDVNIYEIYTKLVSDLCLAYDPIKLAEMEFEIDLEMISSKEVMIDILHDLERQGKIIYIISDTYYLEHQIRRLLYKAGIRCKYELYISSLLGIRKDNGTMWDMINERLMKIGKKSAFIHIGDNVCSDCQISGDYGLKSFHILSPLDKWQATGFHKIRDVFSIEDPSSILKWGSLVSQIGSDPFL